MRKSHAILIALLVIVAAITNYWLNRPGTPRQIPTALQSVLWPEPKPLPDFQLTNHQGQPLTREQFRNHWTFLFFGYTSCPDVCPSTLAILKAVAEQLDSNPAASNPVQYIFVSVDPERDTPERLADYVRYFHPSFIGATGSSETIARLTRELYILYERAETRSETDYDINHTASILLIDPQARLFGKFSPPHQPAEMATMYGELRQHYR